jgi:hypothetical protein
LPTTKVLKSVIFIAVGLPRVIQASDIASFATALARPSE